MTALTPAQEEVTTRAALIARMSVEADSWLRAEVLGGCGLRAMQVLAAIKHRCVCNVDAVAWLRHVADGRTRKALHAAVILRELELHGQLGDGLA